MKSFAEYLVEAAPPGWSGTVTAMLKKHPEIDNPYALAWSMKKKGKKPHYKKTKDNKTTGTRPVPEKKEKYKDEKPKKKKKHKKFSEWVETKTSDPK